MDLVDGYSVLEIGEYVAVPYAGKLFSDLGADVLKVEPPDGDVARRISPFSSGPGTDSSGFFGYLNTGKRSVTAPENGLGRDVIGDLVESEGIDLLLENRLSAYGIDPASLSDAYPAVSVVSLSGFGATGPWQDYLAPDLVAWAESGQMNKMGYPDRAPTRTRIKSADYWGGQMAAIAGLSALFHRDVQGHGGQFVDVSKREAAISAMEFFIAGYSWGGEPTMRRGDGYPDQGPELGYPTIYEAADGYVSAAVLGTERWTAFCEELLGRPELAEAERFATGNQMRRNSAEVQEIVEGYTRERGKWELFEEFQSVGIPSAVTATPADVVEFEHLDVRGFWQEVPLADETPVTMPGFPFRVDRNEVAMGRPPRLGEHNDQVFSTLGYDATALAASSTEGQSGSWSGTTWVPPDDVGGQLPLDGIRVLDFTWVYAGPVATKLLAALGADVVKVESEHKPDVIRNSRGYDEFDPEADRNVSAYYNEQNLGKRDIRLDLTADRGRELALELIREADVVMENYSPTFMDRVDLDYDTISAENPDIVYCSMPGWGKEGPARKYRSFGLNLQSMSGLDWLSGHPDDPPTAAGFSWPDPTAGFTAVIAVVMGLLRRSATGRGGFIEVPQFETTLSFLHKPLMEYLLEGELPDRTGNRDEDGRYVQGAYECAGEDRWAVVAVETDAQWERLCAVMDRPELTDEDRFSSQYARLRHHDEVDVVIEQWTSQRSPEEVRHLLQSRDIPAGVVANERDLVDYDPQLRARDYFSTHDHPSVGTQSYQGVPFKMSDCRVRFQSRAPLFGEHTEEVLAEWLGYAEKDVAEADELDALY